MLGESLRKRHQDQSGFINDFFATNIGIIMGFGLLGWAMLGGADAQKFFYNPHGIAIVLGGTIAATLISFPISEVLRVFGSFRIVFLDPGGIDYDSIIRESTIMAIKMRKGEDLREDHEYITHPFLRDGVALVCAGYPAQMIKEAMETSIANRSIREVAQVRLLRTLAGYAPTFGMIATVMGLVQMMASMQGNLSDVGQGLAVALVGTFYGLLLSNLVFHPMAEKLESRRIQNMIQLNMILEATLMVQAKAMPAYVEGSLNSFLPPKERVTRFDKKGRFTDKLNLGKSAKKSPAKVSSGNTKPLNIEEWDEE